jgi:hypothetical protein
MRWLVGPDVTPCTCIPCGTHRITAMCTCHQWSPASPVLKQHHLFLLLLLLLLSQVAVLAPQRLTPCFGLLQPAAAGDVCHFPGVTQVPTQPGVDGAAAHQLC